MYNAKGRGNSNELTSKPKPYAEPVAILRLTVWLKQDPNPLIHLLICAQFPVILSAFSVPPVGFQQGLAFYNVLCNVLCNVNKFKRGFFLLRVLPYGYEFSRVLVTCYEVSSAPISCSGDSGFKSRFKDWLFCFTDFRITPWNRPRPLPSTCINIYVHSFLRS